MNFPIYLDNAATTPIHPSVLEAMNEILQLEFGNSGSQQHIFGWKAEEAIENARQRVATYFKVKNRQIIFTSGATESNNLAIQGFLKNFSEKGHLITSLTEHKSVLEVFYFYENLGWDVTYLKPNVDGIIDLVELKECIQENTKLISIMWVNNETGHIQPMQEILKIAQENQIVFHCDATQALGKIDLNEHFLPDLLSFSGHKIYGPKGIGGLVINNESIYLHPIIFGGNQERGLRSGTLPTHQIIGLSAAIELIPQLLDKNLLYSEWKRKFERMLLDNFEGKIKLNSSLCGVQSILNFSVQNIDWEELFQILSSLALSNGSACNAKSKEPSHVLKALGLSDTLALSSVRLSMGFMNNPDDMDFVLSYLEKQLKGLQ
ncbi:MAG: hypothetical protein RJA76_619 [Bacteroidota bacterium]|jgi:cysteine desulfurase